MSGATRRQVLVAGAAGAAALAVPAVALSDDREDRAKAALAAVLALEQTALVAYEAIANSGVLTPTLRPFLEQERQHADQLVAALEAMGAKPPIPPRRTAIPRLRAATRSRHAALRFALGIESRTVAAYAVAVGALGDPNVMRTAAGAMGTDAQQLVVLRELAGDPPVPRPIETGSR